MRSYAETKVNSHPSNAFRGRVHRGLRSWPPSESCAEPWYHQDQNEIRGLGTTKAMYQDFTKTCTKTFTSIKSWYGSYAPGGFTRKSLMRVFCSFFLIVFFCKKQYTYIYMYIYIYICVKIPKLGLPRRVLTRYLKAAVPRAAPLPQDRPGWKKACCFSAEYRPL